MYDSTQESFRRIHEKLDKINDSVHAVCTEVAKIHGRIDLLSATKVETEDIKIQIAACQQMRNKKPSYPPPAPLNDKTIKIVVTALGLVGAALWLLQGELL